MFNLCHDNYEEMVKNKECKIKSPCVSVSVNSFFELLNTIKLLYTNSNNRVIEY